VITLSLLAIISFLFLNDTKSKQENASDMNEDMIEVAIGYLGHNNQVALMHASRWLLVIDFSAAS